MFATRCVVVVLTVGAIGCGESAAQQADAVAADVAKTTVPPPTRDGFDWPVFLGPDSDGTSAETNLITTWDADGPDLLWDREIGTGYSAPSVLGNRLVVFHRDRDEEVVECLRADTGEPLWTSRYESNFRDPYGYNNGPRCSPLLTDELCYTFGAEGVVRCARLSDGELVWQRKTSDEFDVPKAFFGVGSTPILVDDVLVVPVGGQPNSGLVGMNPQTGETLWESVGRDTWDGVATGWRREPNYEWSGDEMVVSYSSPVAATFHGRTHVLCLTRQGLVSVDPKTGDENFHYWFRSEKHESVNASRPVVVGNTILVSSTYGVGAARLDVQQDGKGFDVMWATADTFETHWSTAIYHDGFYYGFSSRHEQSAEMVCIDATTGEVMWTTNGWGDDYEGLSQNNLGQFVDKATEEVIPWPFYGRGSAVLANGYFYVLAERGTLACVKADPKSWIEVSRSTAPEMNYPSWPAPVLSRGRLYLRDEDSLVCLDLRPSS